MAKRRWQQPQFGHPRVRALMSCRSGGVSASPYDSLNLGSHVGDGAAEVTLNRRRFEALLGLPLVRLQQVHGVRVVPLQWPWPVDTSVQADASYTVERGLACEVQVADCLPVLFADRLGRVVAAAHAGWRGLAGGVLEATLARCCEVAGAQPADIEAWLGPCIGPQCFEVGADVLQGFGHSQPQHGDDLFGFAARAGVPGKWWADLPALARSRLQALGVVLIQGNDGSPAWCTVQQGSDFFSFRRDGVTGRMSAAVGLLDDADPALA